MHKSWKISRRTMLRGLGAVMALPLLDVMGPTTVRAAAAVAKNPTSMTKMAFLYFPNGAHDSTWPAEQVGEGGKLLKLNKWMKVLEPFKDDLIIPRKVWTPNGNGHGAGTATWLTGSSYNRRGINAGGISVDQFAAQHVGQDSVMPTLQLSTRGEGFFSNSLSRNTLSWEPGNRPAYRETEPRAIFDRMFRGGDNKTINRSVLDLVRDDAKSLRRDVGTADQRKLDEYLEAVRAIEKGIEFANKQAERAVQEGALTDTLQRPEPGIPTDHKTYVQQMMDMMVLAFWSNATRICTFMLDHGQSNRYFDFLPEVHGTWHALSHWSNASAKTEDDVGNTAWNSPEEKRDMYSAVVSWHHEQVAYLLGKMKAIADGNGSLLDNSMILYGSSLADGDEHAARNLPLILAGRGGGTINSGRVLEFERNTNVSNMHLSMLHRMGIDVDQFAESDGPMTELDV